MRKPRAIRFSDSEWDEVKKAAEDRGVPAAEYVRETILDTARNHAVVASLAIRADLVPLIERTFRYTYMLATRMREDLIHDGQGDQAGLPDRGSPQTAGHPPEHRGKMNVSDILGELASLPTTGPSNRLYDLHYLRQLLPAFIVASGCIPSRPVSRMSVRMLTANRDGDALIE